MALKRLTEELSRSYPPAIFERQDYLSEIAKLRKAWVHQTTRWRTLESVPIAQSTVIGVVNDFCNETDVVVSAAGSLPGDLMRFWRTRDPMRRGYHVEYGYSTMGYEIAGGIGVKLADPTRDVYVMVGDGSFLMASQDIVTAVQEGIAITVVLIDNHGHRSIYGCQTGNDLEAFGTEYRMRDPETNTLSGDYLPIDFMKIAEGYGAQAIEADTIGALRNALEAAKSEKTRPTVVYVQTDPSHETMPTGINNWWDVPRPEVGPRGKQLQTRKKYLKDKSRQVVR